MVLLLAAGSTSVGAAEAVSGSVVRDLYYGETLFHFYQDEHFDALTHLLVARDSGRVGNHEAESELLLGGLYLHYGQHIRAEQIFSRLLQDSTEAEVRNRAWFYLGKVRYQRSLHAEALDAFDRVAGDATWEQALFHCFNEIRAARGRLLVSASQPLSALPIALPDLASRLAWGVRQALQPPADEGKLAILQQRARAMRIEVPLDVQNYLLRYGRRDMASLLAALEQLQDAAFAGKRKITVPLAREVLGELLGDRHGERPGQRPDEHGRSE